MAWSLRWLIDFKHENTMAENEHLCYPMAGLQ